MNPIAYCLYAMRTPSTIPTSPHIIWMVKWSTQVKWQSNEWIIDRHRILMAKIINRIIFKICWELIFFASIVSFHPHNEANAVNGDRWLAIHSIPFMSKNQCHILILISLFCMHDNSKRYLLYHFIINYALWNQLNPKDTINVCRAKSHCMNETWLSFSWPVNI